MRCSEKCLCLPRRCIKYNKAMKPSWKIWMPPVTNAKCSCTNKAMRGFWFRFGCFKWWVFHPGCIGHTWPKLTSFCPQAPECFHRFSLTLHPVSSHMQWSWSKNALYLKRVPPRGDRLENREQSPKFRKSADWVFSVALILWPTLSLLSLPLCCSHFCLLPMLISKHKM